MDDVPSDVDELSFTADSGSGAVPAVAWLPRRGESVPVVLLGHGGSGSKRSARTERLGRWFARNGLAALAIDGPFHGDRSPADGVDYQRLIVDRGVETVMAEMVDDWVAALDELASAGRVDPDHVGYVGLSMGTRFGLPLVARLRNRCRGAVFGKFGLTQTAALDPGLDTPELIRRQADAIRAPLLFHVQWDDEVFPRAGALALFDAFGSPDTTLLARPGPHAGVHPDDEPTWCAFVAAHLSPLQSQP